MILLPAILRKHSSPSCFIITTVTITIIIVSNITLTSITNITHIAPG